MSLEVCSIALGTSWPWNHSLPIDCSTDYTSLYSPISNICVVTKCTISLVDIWLEKLLKLRYSSTANHWLLWSDTLNLFLRDFKELEFYILTISGIRAWVCGGTVGRRYYKSVSVITSVYRNYCDQKKMVDHEICGLIKKIINKVLHQKHLHICLCKLKVYLSK